MGKMKTKYIFANAFGAFTAAGREGSVALG